MRYMLRFFAEESGWDDVTPEQMREGLKLWDDFHRQATDAGAAVAGEGLQSRSARAPRSRSDR